MEEMKKHRRNVLLAMPALVLGLTTAQSSLAQADDWFLAPEPQVFYVGAGAVNDLVGAHIEVANAVGSVWVLIGEHLDVSSAASFEQGRATGFAAGIRFFTNGQGLESGWYGGVLGGTLDVAIRQDNCCTQAYQRLGFGASLGYQYLLDRLRLGLGLGASYLEPYTTVNQQRIGPDYTATAEATLGLRF